MILDEMLNKLDDTVYINYAEFFIFYWGGWCVASGVCFFKTWLFVFLSNSDNHACLQTLLALVSQ